MTFSCILSLQHPSFGVSIYQIIAVDRYGELGVSIAFDFDFFFLKTGPLLSLLPFEFAFTPLSPLIFNIEG